MSTAKKIRKPVAPVARKPRILVLEGLTGAAACVRRAGGDPVSVSPRMVDLVEAALAEPFDGLLLTGGGDVDPALYGEKPHPKCYGISPVRDYCEWAALDAAQAAGVPVLGICRGSQLMAVHNGGKLNQHIGGHRGIDHLVFGESGSRFRRIIKGERAMFVSLHHQTVLRHGPGFRVAARDSRGHIEAIESRDGRCLGVQFHPEMDYHSNEPSRRIFDWLVAAAAAHAGLVAPKRVQRVPVRPASAPRPKTRMSRGVTSRFFCRHCGLEFDRLIDREDHEYWICGTPELRVSEPPPGHPDWVA